jgi:hypothetical protein
MATRVQYFTMPRRQRLKWARKSYSRLRTQPGVTPSRRPSLSSHGMDNNEATGRRTCNGSGSERHPLPSELIFDLKRGHAVAVGRSYKETWAPA